MSLKQVTDTAGVVGSAGVLPGQTEAERAIRKAISEDTGVASQNLKVKMTFTEALWPNGSLGVSEPGRIYSNAQRPGYRVVAEARGNWYVFHTDQSGRAKQASKIDSAVAKEVLDEARRVAAPHLGAEESEVANIEVKDITQQVFPEPRFGPGRARTEFAVELFYNGKSQTVSGELGSLTPRLQLTGRPSFGGGAAVVQRDADVFQSGGGAARI